MDKADLESLPIAPSTDYDHLAKRADPTRLSDRDRRDASLRPEIKRVFEDSQRVYGVHKIWRQLDREGFDVARCTIARLMKDMGIQAIIRGKPHRPSVPDKKAPCPLDKVNRRFKVPAPNMLWGRPCWRHWSEPNGRRFHLRRHLEGLCLCGHSSGKQSTGPFIDPRHSSTPKRARSSAGGRAKQRMQASCSTPWNRQFTTDVRSRARGARPPFRPRVEIPVDQIH